MKLPVIRGHVGDWGYYTGVMKFKEVEKIVSPSVNEFCNPSCLNDLLQRQLTENYKSIVEYLLSDEQRFFNAIVLAIYDGDPKWLEIEFGEEFEDYNNMGFLSFDENLKVFPVDGQHRVKGIIEALKENREIEDEEVPVIFIAHKNTVEGKRRTRKLFSTLNRRAKPVGENYQIALDEDDLVAIVTREIIEEFPLFQKERLLNNKNKQIPKSNKDAFTSLVALYQCNEKIIKDKLGITDAKFKEYKLYRPEDSNIEEMIKYVESYWEAFISRTDVIKEFVTIDNYPAEKFRNDNGGNLLFRPIGLIEYVGASIEISNRNAFSFDETLEKLNTEQLNISVSPWKGVVWDGKKIINRVNLDLIRLMILQLFPGSVLSADETEQLIDLYVDATNFEGRREKVLDIFYK